ncbi:MAG TPA: hypothetical protein VD994_15015 [Prosthecobacter sp.]|nr:hypothetical protein [Prosthecobacter sp.]
MNPDNHNHVREDEVLHVDGKNGGTYVQMVCEKCGSKVASVRTTQSYRNSLLLDVVTPNARLKRRYALKGTTIADLRRNPVVAHILHVPSGNVYVNGVLVDADFTGLKDGDYVSFTTEGMFKEAP